MLHLSVFSAESISSDKVSIYISDTPELLYFAKQMSEYRYDIRISESCADSNPLMVERQDPDNFTRFKTRERCALEIAAYVFKQTFSIIYCYGIFLSMTLISLTYACLQVRANPEKDQGYGPMPAVPTKGQELQYDGKVKGHWDTRLTAFQKLLFIKAHKNEKVITT